MNLKTVMNGLYAFGIAANTSLIMINLYEFNNMNTALFNFGCGLLCWVGYYRTKEDGNESGN